MRPIQPGDHVYLIDGSGYIFRAYHALPPLTRSDGMPVGAVQGFCNMLWKLLEDTKNSDKPTHFAVIFDAKRENFRNKIYPEYKANRPPAPDDLVPQFPIIRDAVRAFNAPCIEMEGYEADDLIATYARQAEAQGAVVTIVSSDKDLMQLVGPSIAMLDTMKNRRIGKDEVFERFGVGPDKVVDVQALAGDSSDNVPGVPGIGVKTAALLVNEYGGLDEVLERAGEIKQNKRRENLIEFADLARISRDLVRLEDKAPVKEPLAAFGVREPDDQVLRKFLNEMEFGKLAARITGETVKTEIDRSAYEIIKDEAELAAWIKAARDQGYVAVDTETTSLDAMQARLVGVSMALGPGKACYIPLAHRSGGFDFDGDGMGQMEMEAALGLLKPLFEDPSVLKIGQNLKYDGLLLSRLEIDIQPIDDTMLLSYTLDSGLGGHGMDELSSRHLGHDPIPYKQIAGSGKKQITFDEVPIDKAAEYASEDADVTLALWQVLKPRLVKESMSTVYETLERPLVKVLINMEQAGIKIDREELARLSAEFAQKMAGIEEDIYQLAGKKFNIASPAQLGEILFGVMGLEGGKKTKTGAWSTNAAVLEDLALQGVELPVRVLEWRTLAKLKSTYTDALPGFINPETGRVHTSYSMAATTTGRLASSDPNLQNIPVRTTDGRRIRRAFIADKGFKLISADYSQIELRVLAHMADIAELKQAFADGLDIHAMTASEMFGVALEDMQPDVRRRAKAINFGIIYGISAFGLANQLGISRSEAADYIKTYFKRFPGILGFMEEMKQVCRDKGYVETAFGRRCHYPEINSKNPQRRAFMERAAINAPIQGTAADIIRRAMLLIEGAGLPAKMLLQVHDELIFEAEESRVEAVIKTATGIMERACEPALALTVPLKVDARAADNWDDAH